MKKTYSLILLVFALSLTACTQNHSNAQTQSDTKTQPTRSNSNSGTTEKATLGNDSVSYVSPDYWIKQKNKALETRSAPVGFEVKGLIIPDDLTGLNGKQNPTIETMKTQNFAVPMDFFDLAERNLNGELVELPSATENYVVDVGEIAIVTDKAFTKFDFNNEADIPASNSNSQKRTNVPAADSDDQKKLNALANKFKLDLNSPNDRKQIRLRLLRMIAPKAKPVLEEIAQKYQAKFNRPLLVTSLIRSIDYSVELNKVDSGSFLVKRDGAIPPHCTGLAFDFAVKNLTAEEQNFIAGILAEMDRSGKVDAVRETGGPNSALHVFVL